MTNAKGAENHSAQYKVPKNPSDQYKGAKESFLPTQRIILISTKIQKIHSYQYKGTGELFRPIQSYRRIILTNTKVQKNYFDQYKGAEKTILTNAMVHENNSD